ncbi:MAG: hypothetical protein WKG00_33625 [Polyangiaceae bacterium]
MAQRVGATGPGESIELYARILAALEDPFADESRVLAAFGLTRTGFAGLQQNWSARLTSAGGASDLARAFTSAYAAARREGRRAGRHHASGGGSERAGIGDEETVDLHGQVPAEVFPFQAPLGCGDDEAAPWR